jgi:hypothetical protein
MIRRSQTLLALALLPWLSQVQSESQEAALATAAADSSVQWGPCPAFMPKGCGLAVLHGDPARPNADVFLKIPAKAALPHHWHSSAERMVLVSGELTVQYDGQPASKLRPGTYAYGPAKLGHSGSCTSADDCILFIAFEGPVDAIATTDHKK